MIKDLKYIPIFRARQQEILVLREFDFGKKMCPLIEIVKAKDRKNNPKTPKEIYSELIKDINANVVFVDLPVSLKEMTSTQDEVIIFNRKIIQNLNKRIEFYKTLGPKSKIIPVISSLSKAGGTSSISVQCNELRQKYNYLCFRTFTNSFDSDINEISNCLSKNDYFIYDLDTISTSNPIFTKHRKQISKLICARKILVRSAINTEIYNVNLIHDDVVAEADNSLYELYNQPLHFDAFGDYVGIKKDDLTAGGSISPGFIMYNPLDNLYYGFKGNKKSLSEFEDTIVPDVLASDVVKDLKKDSRGFITKNPAFEIINNIYNQIEPGKNQAKFKRISMLHYLYCMKLLL